MLVLKEGVVAAAPAGYVTESGCSMYGFGLVCIDTGIPPLAKPCRKGSVLEPLAKGAADLFSRSGDRLRKVCSCELDHRLFI